MLVVELGEFCYFLGRMEESRVDVRLDLYFDYFWDFFFLVCRV